MHQEAATLVSPGLLVQGYRFALVGLLSTAVNYLANLAALSAIGNAAAASAVGYLAGVAVGFPLNSRWSFRAGAGGTGTAFRYLLVYFATFLLNGVLAEASHSLLDAGGSAVGGVPMRYLYYLPVIAVTTVLNFVGCKAFVFGK